MGAIRTDGYRRLVGVAQGIYRALGIEDPEKWHKGAEKRVQAAVDAAYRMGRNDATHDPTPQEAHVHARKLAEALAGR